jgi:hypothetical protein
VCVLDKEALLKACEQSEQELQTLQETLQNASYSDFSNIEKFLKCSDLYYQTGNYVKANEGLRNLLQKATSGLEIAHKIQVHWGLLCTGILIGDIEQAASSALTLRDLFDGKSSYDNMQLLTQRAWLLNTILFVLFEVQSDKERFQLLDVYMSPVYVHVMQIVCPELLVYVLAGILSLTTTPVNHLQELAKVLKMEKESTGSSADDLSDIIVQLYVEFESEKLVQKIVNVKSTLLTRDFFLKRNSEKILSGLCTVALEYYSRVFTPASVQSFIDDVKAKVGVELSAPALQSKNNQSQQEWQVKLQDLNEKSNSLLLKLQ